MENVKKELENYYKIENKEEENKGVEINEEEIDSKKKM